MMNFTDLRWASSFVVIVLYTQLAKLLLSIGFPSSFSYDPTTYDTHYPRESVILLILNHILIWFTY